MSDTHNPYAPIGIFKSNLSKGARRPTPDTFAPVGERPHGVDKAKRSTDMTNAHEVRRMMKDNELPAVGAHTCDVPACPHTSAHFAIISPTHIGYLCANHNTKLNNRRKGLARTVNPHTPTQQAYVEITGRTQPTHPTI